MNTTICYAGALIATLLFGSTASAQTDGGTVQSARKIWSGPDPMVSVAEIALRVAPILWFTPEEPHALAKNPTPAPLPCDPNKGDEPVVYYRRVDPGWDSKWFTVDQYFLVIEYYFYYLHDYGMGCHTNDLETVRMHLRMRPGTAAESGHKYTESELAFLSNSSSTSPSWESFVVSLDYIEADAHGSKRYANRLDLWKAGAEDTVLPPTLLVEEGKHAVAPDRNADGEYTPGYDVNAVTNDAWGVRDSFGSGHFWGNAYRAHMAKRRHERDRIMANPHSHSDDLWSDSYRSTWADLPVRRYELREFPEDKCASDPDNCRIRPNGDCGQLELSSLLREKGLQPARDVVSWLNTNQSLRQVLSGVNLRASFAESAVKEIGLTLLGPGVSLPMSMGWLNFKAALYNDSVQPPNNSVVVVGVGVVSLGRVSGLAVASQGYGRRQLGRGKPKSGTTPRVREPVDVSTAVASARDYWKYYLTYVDPPDADVIIYYTPSLSWPATWYVGGGVGLPGIAAMRAMGVITEIGLQFRKHPQFVFTLGLRHDRLRGSRPVMEFGLGF